MEEMEEKDKIRGDVKMKSPFLTKLDNFFYHYKWHSIIALFLVIVFLVCALQMCGQKQYDLEVMYAGPKNLSDRQTVLDIQNAFADIADDRTGDGVKTVNLVSYWVDDSLWKELTDGKEDGEKEEDTAGRGQLMNNSYNNEKAFVDEIAAGNVVICLVSPYLFHMVDDEAGFMRVTDVFPDLAEYEEEVCVYDEDGDINRFGVYLSKTAFGEKAGLSSLPDDTVLCVRKKAALSFWYNGDKAEEKHAYSVEVFRRALALGKRETD